MKGVEIREKVQRKLNIGISRCMAYRAKAIACDDIDGSFNEQYKRIYDYAHEVLGRNPGSTVKVEVENNQDEVIFKRFYCCLKACKDSFVCCRSIIGLDGAFLKGKYGGELLTAVGRDGNDQMLPIAYAVVEGENKDSWTWFLNLLIDDLGGEEVCSSITFVSDQQKGLLPAIQQLLPGVDQRFCVRHLYSNFRKKFPGKNLKRLMWRAATATHPENWEREMKNIKDVNEDAFKHLIAIPPRIWQITGIPCCHSLAAMKFFNIDGQQFIPACFLKSTYEETYASIIYPINGNNMWAHGPYPDVMPPRKKVMPGRPKRKRRLK
ncbi:uncharacterized protein LOC108321409 [Vigna angularis]|uniref:uncharacterized protein LOC108321409 n=1 Tax=Phaseolus angularis TaxID=3914 RepID=UPI00080A229F|nr:uncharacterized protein LOC108321409 [Vigna angularis]